VRTRLGFLAILVFFLAYLLYSSFASFTICFDPSQYQEVDGQLIRSNGIMSDADLYAYVGWLYVRGRPEYFLNTTGSQRYPPPMYTSHPPLAMYLIGLSIIVFNNQNIMSLVFASLTLITTYIISRRVLGETFFTLIPPFILCLDKMFRHFSTISMLDIYLTFFVAFSVILYIYALKRPAFFPLFSLALGLAIASKWSAAFLIPACIVYLIVRRDWKGLKLLLLSLPLAVLSYILVFTVFFVNGYTFQEFINLNLDSFKGQSERRYQVGKAPFWILLNLLTGISGPGTSQVIYISKTGEIIGYGPVVWGLHMLEYFNPFTWPITFSASILAIYYAWRNREYIALFPTFWFFSFLTFMVNMGSLFEWYLLPILPAGYIAIAYVIKNIYMDSKNKRLAKLIITIYCTAIAVWSLFIEVPAFIPLS
jgi:dolichyl-phosphate-mannose--protein O-mannosyl transferase